MKILTLVFVIMFLSCSSIPDQDACIDVWTSRDSSSRFVQIDYNKTYDTTLSTLECELLYNGAALSGKIEVKLFSNDSLINQGQTSDSKYNAGWLKAGFYSLQIGKKEQYPCLNIYQVRIPGGRGCTLIVNLPADIK